jgi:hypothetical protein
MSCNKCIRDKLECLHKSFEHCNKWLHYKGHPISVHLVDGSVWYIYCLPEGIRYSQFHKDGTRGDPGYSSWDVYSMDEKSGYPFPF